MIGKGLIVILTPRSPDVVIKELDEDGQEDSGKGGEEKEEKEDDALKDSFRWFSQVGGSIDSSPAALEKVRLETSFLSFVWNGGTGRERQSTCL